MKQNITLSIDKDLLRKARVIAAQKQTSVSQMLSQELGRIVNQMERYEAAKRSALSNLKEGYHLGGRVYLSREELHER